MSLYLSWITEIICLQMKVVTGPSPCRNEGSRLLAATCVMAPMHSVSSTPCRHTRRGAAQGARAASCVSHALAAQARAAVL